MKKHLFITVLFLAVTGITCSAQTFQRIYGGNANPNAFAHCVQQTNDGGFIVAGQIVSPNIYYDVYLIKLNGIGDTLWTKTFSGGSFSLEPSYVHQNNDSGYIVCGKAGNAGFLIRTNAAGNILWSKTIQGFNFFKVNEVHQTSDGGFIVMGWVSDLATDHILLLKTDGNGTITWQKILSSGAANADEGWSVQQTSDGGYIVTGATINPGVSGGMLLVKTDATGSVLWTKTFNAPGTFNIGYSVKQTTDGGYVIAGSTYTTNYDAYLVKTNSTGDTLWTRAYGGANPDYALAVQKTNDGGYVLAGYTQSFGAGGAEGYLVKTDSAGNLSWSKAYGGGANPDLFYSGMQTNDGGYIAAGSTTSFGPGGVNVYLVKTDASGNSGCNEMNAGTVVNVPPCIAGTIIFTVSPGVAVPALSLTTGSGGTVTSLCFTSDIHEMENEELPITIYPNPFSSETTISFTDFIQSGEVEIFTTQGEIIYRKKILNTSNIKVQVENIIPGMYFMRLNDGEQLFIKKIIIQ